MNKPAALTCMEENLAGFQIRMSAARKDSWNVRSGNLCATYTGIGHAMFNNVLRSNLNRVEAELVVARFEETGLPWGWFVSATSADSTPAMLGDLGFAKAFEMRNMACDLRTNPVDRDSRGLRIERVGNAAGFEAFLHIVLSAFKEVSQIGADMSRAQNLMGYGDELAVQNFVGYEGDVPVATATVHLTEGVAGIYAVSTLEQHRGKGYGRAITAHCMAWGQNRGCRLAVLQASQMGLPVYQKLGFEDLGPSACYIRP